MHINIKEIKAGKMTQWPRALSGLAEDPGSVPGHTRKLTVLYNSSSWGYSCPLQTSADAAHMGCTYIHADRVLRHIK